MKSAVLVDSVDFFRLDANRKLDPDRRSEFGQFMTPPATAQLMASMFEAQVDHVRLLDPGAGVGSLTAAFVNEICARHIKPKTIHATVYEIDAVMLDYLADTLKQCQKVCEQASIEFNFDLKAEDFINDGAQQLSQAMFKPATEFNCAILNPPYKKIHSGSAARQMLREIGIETSNLYTGFLAVVLKLLSSGGELVAITPRSFCNGPYFKPFRKLFLDTMAVQRIHIFESRHVAFSEDDVLQENVILHGIKHAKNQTVTITSSTGPEDEFVSVRTVHPDQLVDKCDPEYFMHIVSDGLSADIAKHAKCLETTLPELGIDVSTGRVVDFRATHFLRMQGTAHTVPLIYPRNFVRGFVQWPIPGGKKPQAIAALPGAEDLLTPKGIYVLVKRFSAKEENRRIIAAIYDPARIPAEQVGFENHVNFYHVNGAGLPPLLAKGLSGFLNSTFIDMYFRQFSGHTQVNATDLRNMRYPTKEQLEHIGLQIGDEFPAQETLDQIIEETLNLAKKKSAGNPIHAKKKIEEGLEVLKSIGLPRAQLNERSSLTLLALLDLTPRTSWSQAKDPLVGITQMMSFFEEHYGKRYAPNTRETVRRQTVHQFLEASIVSINPDDPERPTNSAKTVYQMEPGLLKLLRNFGTKEWEKGLTTYLASTETLKKKYAQERQMKRIPVKVGQDKTITLSPGGQNVLVKAIIDDFCPVFAGGGQLVYVGDADERFAHFDALLLKSLGVDIEQHGKMPDVVIFAENKNWLILIEAVTSHGPVNPQRRDELKTLFRGSTVGLVFITAFLDRRSMLKWLGEISWETEVWVAESPTHLIHFNGERFLGPHNN